MLYIITVIILLILSYIIIIYKTNKENKYLNKSVSLKESMDLVGLPIITVNCDTTKLNFLLDTGSNMSQVNTKVLSCIKYKINKDKNSVIGIEGNAKNTDCCLIDFNYKNQFFTNTFLINDLSKVFDTIKVEYGVQIHGIIGNDFITKYKYILDFDKYIAYPKK